MNKHCTITNITPLPSYVTRKIVLSILHDHPTIITLNPMVMGQTRCDPPSHALPDELDSAWYEIIDKVEYFPGTGVGSNVTYNACMHNLPRGLQTHIHAPAGLEIRGKWQVLGSLPGEKREPVELSAQEPQIPKEGLYLREDCDLKCNFFVLPMVKKNIHKSHRKLVEKLIERAGDVTSGQVSLHSAPSSQRSTPSSLQSTPSPVHSNQLSLHLVTSHIPSSSGSSFSSSSGSTFTERLLGQQQEGPALLSPSDRLPTPDGFLQISADSSKSKFNEQQHRAMLGWYTNGYSVSVTGGNKRQELISHPSYTTLVEHGSSRPTMQRDQPRGRSRSPANVNGSVKASFDMMRRYPSAEPMSRATDSPTPLLERSSSFEALTLARTRSWNRRMGVWE